MPREAARRDIEDAVEYFLSQGAPAAAEAFLEQLEQAFASMARYSHAGSTRYATILGLADLRSWLIGAYPYLVFYVVRSDHVDVWRVLHAERDLPSWMRFDE